MTITIDVEKMTAGQCADSARTLVLQTKTNHLDRAARAAQGKGDLAQMRVQRLEQIFEEAKDSERDIILLAAAVVAFQFQRDHQASGTQERMAYDELADQSVRRVREELTELMQTIARITRITDMLGDEE